jgi:hypothetical protein
MFLQKAALPDCTNTTIAAVIVTAVLQRAAVLERAALRNRRRVKRLTILQVPTARDEPHESQ